MTELRIRQAVRALLLTPDDEALLVRFEFPTRHVWALPGGGLQPGEDHLTALRRELREEVAPDEFEIGPHIWTREHVIPMFDDGVPWDGQRDQIHLVRTDRFEPRPELSWDELRAERLFEIRWWTFEEIAAESTIGFAPRNFATVLTDLLTHGPPSDPVDTGI